MMIDAVHIHLMFSHIPVLATPLGVLLLLLSIIWKNHTLRMTALGLFMVAALIAIPVYLTGEPSEEVVESLPGVQEVLIEQHEDFGKIGLIGGAITGLLALVSLVLTRTKSAYPLKTSIFLLMSGIVASGLLIQTAYLGGQVRHSEIRPTAYNSPKAAAPIMDERNSEYEDDEDHE